MSKADEIRAALQKARNHREIDEDVFELCAAAVAQHTRYPRSLVNHYARELFGDPRAQAVAAANASKPSGPLVKARGIEISRVLRTYHWGMLKDQPVEERTVTVGKHTANLFFWKGTATYSIGECAGDTFDVINARLAAIGDTKLLRMLP